MLTQNLQTMIEQARHYQMSDAEKQAQRISFAYGNVKLSNDQIRRDVERIANAFDHGTKADHC